jgi:NTE family protein
MPFRDGPNRPTHRALQEYFGRRPTFPGRIGLCLSGGGFRAALFHLGSLRRINELGALSRLDLISAVSGGSIVAAHLAQQLYGRWPTEGTKISDWDSAIEMPFRKFVERDIRTAPVLRSMLPQIRQVSAAESLRNQYAKHLSNLRLDELTDGPEIIFGATELVHRRYWSSSRSGVGSPSTGYPELTPKLSREWTVARAVAASSCFPPVFRPMDITKLVPDWYLDRLGEAYPKRLLLSDGGLYDNTGYLAAWNKCDTVLISDGGGSVGVKYGDSVLYRLLRYQSVQEYSGRGWTKAFILSNLMSEHQEGAYWGLHTKTAKYGVDLPATYPSALVEGVISKIRTDLAPFTKPEQEILINHGYLLAAAAMRRWALALDDGTTAITVPYPIRMDPGAVAQD